MKDWERYEQTAQYLLNEFATNFGLGTVEGKQIVPAVSGTEYEIDAKGVKIDGSGFLIVECRRRNARLDQEAVGALVYRINATGAQGGILVTPHQLQEGARKVAEHEGVYHVILDKESTTEAYVIEFLDKVIMGFHESIGVSDSVEITWIP
ncbi:MAG: restriction endonuclease [Chloroflexi bacterium]|nr:restriction endonuclease [Chloroflexota bacterium]